MLFGGKCDIIGFMNYIFTFLVPLLVGTTVMIGNVVVDTDKIMASAWEASNLANQHQIRTVLELYYLDHNKYPEAYNAEGLFKELVEGGYIKSKPVNPEVFDYKVKNGYQDYDFNIKK